MCIYLYIYSDIFIRLHRAHTCIHITYIYIYIVFWGYWYAVININVVEFIANPSRIYIYI